ncbi:hypothetical protein I4U23_010113 [Adineta vaga]|nr:hypothetical protein I4U23_010113 [Adineta vaga]
MLAEYWQQILELNIYLEDRDKFGEIVRQETLTNEREICGEELYPGLQETSAKSFFINEPDDLKTKGQRFFGSTTRNEVPPLELIFYYRYEISRRNKEYSLTIWYTF